MPITIDPEFEALIPKLQPQELAHLEASILAEGCRDGLRIWRPGPTAPGVLIDGHNRYRICKKWDRTFNVTYIDLPDRDAAILWIEKNQLGRRNITDSYRKYLLGDIAEREATASRARQLAEARKAKADGGSVVDENVHDSRDEKRTRTKVAKENGVSEYTLKQVKKIRDAAKTDPKAQEVVTKIRDGEITLAKAAGAVQAPAPKNKSRVSPHRNPHAEYLDRLRELNNSRFLDMFRALPDPHVKEQILQQSKEVLKVIASIIDRIEGNQQ